MENRVRFIISGIVVLVIGVIITLSGLKFVDNHEVGYKFNKLSGELTVLDSKGYFLVNPFTVSVKTIDLRPTQICISTNTRVLNCKLVRFNPEGLVTFVTWHGRKDYNISVNRDINTSFEDLLMTYAYDTETSYSFITIDK